ncbi:MAG: ABC transporter permease [Clostridiaceae bacterium]|nr:ABC transporter permease [Clostridiaceae bacterium]
MLTMEEREAVIERYNLNDSIFKQYTTYLRNLVTLNWGTSYSKKQPISSVLWAAAPWTLLLAFSNLVISTLIGIYLGTKAGLKRRKKEDVYLLSGISFISSMPSFWLGMIFISVFSVNLGWFPIYGGYSMWQNYTGISKVIDVLRHLFLPLSTLVILSISNIFLPMRYALIEVMGEDFVFMAKAKGIPQSIIRYKYIVRNALLPVFTVFMLRVGYIFSGSVVIETVFAYPGLGRIMYDAISTRDYPLIQYSFLLISLMVILSNYITDLLYPLIDPRVVNQHENT